MKAQKIIVLFLAIASGGVAMVGASQYMKSQQGQVAEVKKKELLVAASDLAIDTEITEENVVLEEWPEELVPPDALTDVEEILGMFAKARLFPGEAVLKAKLSHEKQSHGVDVPKGYRVVAIRVELDSSLAGLLRPGDKVDINLFVRKNQEISESRITTILYDVTVFAVNAETKREVDAEGKAIVAKTVSLLLRPDQAKAVTLADKMGELSLTLRHPDDETEEGDDALNAVTLQQILGEPGDADSESNGRPRSDASDDSASAGGFLDYMQEQKPVEPEPYVAAPVQETAPVRHIRDEWKMIQFSPGGVTEFEWDDPTLLPVIRERGDGGGVKAPVFTENNASNTSQDADNPSDHASDSVREDSVGR